MSILNLAFYRFQSLEDLPRWREKLRESCRSLELKGTILLSPEGLNAVIAGEPEKADALLSWIEERMKMPGLVAKRSWSETRPFQRMLVKLKKEIITTGDASLRPCAQPGKFIVPAELKTWIDEQRDFTILDTRNEFEVRVGTFRNARSLGLRSFREFSAKAESLAPEMRQKPLVMFCTGGIRCEKASLILERGGFENVLQLDGGILNYFERCGAEHFEGSCFVFDERLALDGQLKPAPVPPELALMPDDC